MAIVGAVAALLLLQLLVVAIVLLMLLPKCLFGSAYMITACCYVDKKYDGLRVVQAALKRAIKKAKKGTDALLSEQVDTTLILPKFTQNWVAMLRQLPIVDEQELSWNDDIYSVVPRAFDHMENEQA